MYSLGGTDIVSDGGGGVTDELAQLTIPVLGVLLAVAGVVYWLVSDLPAFDMSIASLPAALTAVTWLDVRRVDEGAAFGRRLLGWTLVTEYGGAVSVEDDRELGGAAFVVDLRRA